MIMGYCKLKKGICDTHYPCKVCPHSKITNADRIRAMSDEELAFLLIQYRDDWGDYCTHKGCYATQKEAIEAETEWLKQPTEG
jgi:hypothetical protein